MLSLFFTACSKEGLVTAGQSPNFYADSTFLVLSDQNISYTEGFSPDGSSTAPFAIPLLLDLYCPDNNTTNRPFGYDTFWQKDKICS